MKTIVEPKTYIDNLWGKQRVTETETYRLMKYVLRVEHDDKTLLHNVVTGRLVELEQEEITAIDSLPKTYQPVMNQLVTEHYLVPEGFDEYRLVNQLRKIYQTRQNQATGNAINHYVILPTTYCNARCFYCYESDYPRVHMTEEIANQVIDYIDQHRKGKAIEIQWFGGEPMLGLQRIDQISQGLKDRGVPYTATMISNGYLFDEELVNKAAELWKLRRIQITLDGTEDIYNHVKAYVNVQDNPFHRVLRNIDLLSSKGIQVNVRLNLDFYNQENIKILMEELGERYSGNQHVMVYLNMLFNDAGYEPVNHSDEDIIQLIHIILDYQKRLKELKLLYDNLKPLCLQFSQCMADNPHAIMIQPDGGFCRCEHETVLDRYGSLSEGITDPEKLTKWQETIEHSDNCSECAIYPACYSLRECISGNKPCLERLQKSNYEKYRQRIKSFYIHKMEAERNEEV